MRYTRLEIPHKVLNLKSNLFLKFFLIIPLISIIFGSISVKFLIMPYINKYKNKSILNVSKSIEKRINIPSINSMFFLQAGIFSSEGNASVLVTAIKKNGFSPFIVKDKNQYRVIIDFSDDKKKLLDKMDKLKKIGYNTIINTISLQVINDVTKQEINIMKEYMKYVNNVIKIQYDTAKNYDAKKNEYSEKVSGVLSELNNKLNDIKGLYSDSELVKKVSDFNRTFMSKHEEYIKNLDDKNINASSKNLIEETLLVTDLYKYISQMK